MSHSSEPLTNTQMGARVPDGPEADPNEETAGTTLQFGNHGVTSPASTKRSEVLRHVLPRPHRGHTIAGRKSSPRVTKLEHTKNTLPSLTQSRPRVAFHRAITSFFHNSPIRETPDAVHQRSSSSRSSLQSRAESLRGSVPSLDVVSPGTFLFSGPSLRSAQSGSVSNGTSRLPSLTGNGSEAQSLRRVQSASFSSESASLLEDSILEPYVERGISRSMYDILLGMHTPSEELTSPILNDFNKGCHASSGHGSLPHSSNGSCLTNVVATLLLPYLDRSSWKALRLTCRSWHLALGPSSLPKYSQSHSIPTEILQNIYTYLGPQDFDAARHTCRTWMRASLNKPLLISMLKRGGWWSSVEQDFGKRSNVVDQAGLRAHSSDEWFLSRRISRECSLSALWFSNGLSTARDRTPIPEIAWTDFAELADGYHGTEGRHSAGLVFNASICGQLLLVARHTLIYVYNLRSHSLQPLTSIPCPRRVLAMSMDVTAGRNAVAALLEGRMGMVCELRFSNNAGDEGLVEVHVQSDGHPRLAARTPTGTSHGSEIGETIDIANRHSLRKRASRTNGGSRGSNRRTSDVHASANFNSVDVQANYDYFTLNNTDDHCSHMRNWINHTWNLSLRAAPATVQSFLASNATSSRGWNIPIESGTSTFYRHLCHEDDPPRSVAICPQRRCVAFGCAAGIELHWIDALTGTSLTRWFPLTAPSDYLYFLPPRPGIESAKKLRLISSAAHPDDRPAIARKFFSGRPTVSSLWSTIAYESRNIRPELPGCDHYRATPLSDGHHILFLDPPTDRLFMGCDAPLGGPNKLLRKILFVPPEGGQTPRLYAGAADLASGARVAVAFGDTIMLYSVPPDVVTLSRLEQKPATWDIYNMPPFSSEGRAKDHWLNWLDDSYTPHGITRKNIWPIAVRGTQIGVLRNVCELAVFTQPDITVWAFTLDAQATTWQVRSRVKPTKRSRRFINRSGLIYDSHSLDEVGDVITTDAEELPSPYGETSGTDVDMDDNEGPAGFDGTVSLSADLLTRIPKALATENDEWVHTIDVRGCNAWYDLNGDVIMFNHLEE
ncbi:hypothetical protein CC78DRAFT_155019 [Lojkania enalia]|uniref:F-box domain-containing protein n=1 Tax=Lojkania enalia TaxID=147567 RepID=A0A9P4N8S6_9PLEO|nr:hypothetical protein CC78DRAFT_155019 [Didymosphaeria enalia]